MKPDTVYRGIIGLAVALAVIFPIGLILGQSRLVMLVIALVGGLACLWDYRIGLALFVLLAPLTMAGDRFIFTQRNYLAALLLALWLLQRLWKEKDHLKFFNEPLFGFVLVFLLAGAFSVIYSGLPSWGISFWIQHALLLAMLLVFKEVFKEGPLLMYLVIGVTAVLFLEALLGLGEYFAKFSSLLVTNYRSRGTTIHANIYGQILSMGFVYWLGIFMLIKGRAARWIAAGFGAVILLGMLVSFSRGAFVCLVVGLAFFIPTLKQWRIAKPLALILILGVVLGNLAICFKASQMRGNDIFPRTYEKKLAAQMGLGWRKHPGFLDLILERTQASTGRDAIWRTSWQLFKRRPITGHGFGLVSDALTQNMEMDVEMWAQVLSEYETEGMMGRVPHPHNYLLHVLIETGLIGLALMVWFYTLVYQKVKSQLARFPFGPERIVVLIGATFLLSDLYYGLFETANILGPESTALYLVFNTALIFWPQARLIPARFLPKSV